MYNLAVINGEVYFNSKFHKTNIYINGGIIEKISPNILNAEKVIDAKGKKVIPGIIDPHVHMELNIGKYTSADDFYTGTVVGAYGGVTTIIDFLDPVSKGVDVEAAFNKRFKLAKKSIIDFSFHTTVANPVNETENITKEAIRLKIPSIKLFTAYSESNRRTYEKEICELLKLSKNLGTTILVHAENEDYIKVDNSFKAKDLPINRPDISETSMINKLAELNKNNGGRIYIVHTTCGDSVESIGKNYKDILNKTFFIESCPHYFTLNSSNFNKKDGFRYILAPPLRRENQLNKLKANIDIIYSIGTDHCPFINNEKKQSLLKDIPFGIGGIENSFRIMYNHFGYKVIDKMTQNPAKVYGLYPKKGVLQEGSDADFFIFNSNVSTKINENHSKCDYNLYNGLSVKGIIETTVARGKIIMDNNSIYPNEGNFIPREAYND